MALRDSGAIEQPQYLSGLLLHQCHTAARLDVQTQQRFGIRAAQIEAPTVKFHRQPVGEIDAPGARLIILLLRVAVRNRKRLFTEFWGIVELCRIRLGHLFEKPPSPGGGPRL